MSASSPRTAALRFMVSQASALVERPLVRILIVNWNGWRDTVECLESLKRLNYENHHVVVIDNGSTDESVEQIRAAAPGITVIESGENLGFAGGNNIGLRLALHDGTPLVWLLNNDTTVDPFALDALVEELRHNDRLGIVGSVVYSTDGQVEAWGGGTFNRFLGTTRRHTSRGSGPLEYVVGTSMLLRREVLEDVGFLDEDYFLYLEDVDLCLRAVEKQWRLGVAPASVVFHKGGSSANRGSSRRTVDADRFHAKSAGVFIGRHARRHVWIAAPIRLGGMILRRVLRGEFVRIPHVTVEFVRGLRLGLGRS